MAVERQTTKPPNFIARQIFWLYSIYFSGNYCDAMDVIIQGNVQIPLELLWTIARYNAFINPPCMCEGYSGHNFYPVYMCKV